MKLNGGIPWIDETLLCNCRDKETTTAFEEMSTTTEAWFRTRQPKKITTTKKTTARQTTLPIETTTAERTTTDEDWLTKKTYQPLSPEVTITTKQQPATLISTATFAILTSEDTEATTIPFGSTTWTTSSAYIFPTQAATTMFPRTKKDLEWYKKYSKWRHFLN